ncbi:MAG: DUF4830 domain-containing protein [Clostridiales bacterium]|jgi:hypothetical protein|nr:DUF4830 domain-containing protein [Clostridiales bacterium]
MFVFNFSLKFRIILIAISLALIFIGTIFIVSAASPTYIARKALLQKGYSVGDEPIEVADVNIPSEFDAVYTNYNKIMRQAGYDLTPYKGKLCVRVTYYNERTPGERLDILIYKGKIIGGDRCTVALDGYMLPI